MFPKCRLFGEITQEFARSGRVVPIFCDKHLADNWQDAKWIYDEAKRLKIPMMAGSSLPVVWRYPPVDVQRGTKLKQIVATSHHRLDTYGFHALEAVQSLAERRSGGESGIERVRCFSGDAVWAAEQDGIYDRKLFDAALARLKERPLPGGMRKVKVGFSWALDLAFPRDFAQLTLNPSQGVGQAHFEAGEYVFHQGDLGDALYIIVRGAAEVVKESDGQQEILAQLRAGEMFGELALLNQPTRMASVRCVTALDVIVIRRSEFGVLATNLTSFRENIDRLAAERMQCGSLPKASDASEE